MGLKKTLFLICVASSIEAKLYKIINLTPHKKLSIIAELEGPTCKKQTTEHDIDQKESIEINVSRRCPLKTIAIIPLLEASKSFILTVDKLDDIETIAIKQSADGYKLTYY